MKKIQFQIVLLLCACSMANGQGSSMNLDEAIRIGLKNNFSIQIAGNDLKIAGNNNSAGNAGLLPSLNVTGGVRKNNLTSTVRDQNGITTESNNQQTGTSNLAIALDWTLFNGMGMFIRKEKLGSLQAQQEIYHRAMVENIVSEIIVSYFAVVQSKNSIQVLQNAIDFSNRRYDLTRKKLQIGTTSELAFLKSSTDLNADSASLLRQRVGLAKAKSKLNMLLVLQPDHDFDVTSPIQFDKIMDFNSLKEVFVAANSQINAARRAVDISLLDYRLTNSPKYPQVAFFADYNLSRSNYNFGSSAMIQSSGPVAGLNFSIPVFDGFNKKRVSANAKLEFESTQLEYQQILKNAESSLWQVYNEYSANIKLVTLETANLEVARQTSKISFERFRVGEMSDYELRNIQLSELEAENSLLSAQFEAKKSETELLRLSGKLIQSKANK